MGIELLLQFLPYILIALGLLGIYGYIRHQGTKAADAKWEKAEAAKEKKIEAQVQVAVDADKAIDQKVEEKVDAIKKSQESSPVDGDTFKF